MVEQVRYDDRLPESTKTSSIFQRIIGLFVRKPIIDNLEICYQEEWEKSALEIKDLVRQGKYDLAKKKTIEINTSAPFFHGLSSKDIEQLLFSLRHSNITNFNKDSNNLSIFLQQGGNNIVTMVNQILSDSNNDSFMGQFLYLYNKIKPPLKKRESEKNDNKSLVFYFRHYSDIIDQNYRESYEARWQGCDLIISALMICLLNEYVEIESTKYNSVKIVSRIPNNFPNWIIESCKHVEYCNVSGNKFKELCANSNTSVIYPSSGSLGNDCSVHARGLTFYNQPSCYNAVPLNILWSSGENRTAMNLPCNIIDCSHNIYGVQKEILNVARLMEARL